MTYNIAVIMPTNKPDYLADTIADGLLQLENSEDVAFAFSSSRSRFTLDKHVLPREEFIMFARDADLVIVMWGKKETNRRLAEEIDCWEKTVFVDGSEVGLNRRFDTELQQKILEGTYDDYGKIDKEYLERCPLYFRREKPYINGIIPLPFGIESSYIHCRPGTEKDIDVVCIFGQDEYPPLRRYAREELERFCSERGLSCRTQRTETPGEFYDLLARAKVGVSVGGGGYDTARFWEILGNNCLLLTETIDVYPHGSDILNYDRIWEFANLYDFRQQLHRLASFLREHYPPNDLEDEYQDILEHHLSVARVNTILDNARNVGILP